MKSAVFYGKHDIRIEECPIPEPGEHGVLIKVKACGICGTAGLTKLEEILKTPALRAEGKYIISPEKE